SAPGATPDLRTSLVAATPGGPSAFSGSKRIGGRDARVRTRDEAAVIVDRALQEASDGRWIADGHAAALGDRRRRRGRGVRSLAVGEALRRDRLRAFGERGALCAHKSARRRALDRSALRACRREGSDRRRRGYGRALVRRRSEPRRAVAEGAAGNVDPRRAA